MGPLRLGGLPHPHVRHPGHNWFFLIRGEGIKVETRSQFQCEKSSGSLEMTSGDIICILLSFMASQSGLWDRNSCPPNELREELIKHRITQITTSSEELLTPEFDSILSFSK